LAPGISMIMFYFYCRKNPNAQFSFFGMIQFRGCFIPYFLLMLSFLSGHDATI